MEVRTMLELRMFEDLITEIGLTRKISRFWMGI